MTRPPCSGNEQLKGKAVTTFHVSCTLSSPGGTVAPPPFDSVGIEQSESEATVARWSIGAI